jgi:hypothetical protein
MDAVKGLASGKEYDIIIIGSGTAGASAATPPEIFWVRARAFMREDGRELSGARECIVDQSGLPVTI